MTRSLFLGWIVAGAVMAAVPALNTPAGAASGKACFRECQAWLTRTNNWNTLPRGYCRKKCNYYVGAPSDVLRKAGRKAPSAQRCLATCRTKMRAKPGFLQNPANSRYCKDKCGVR